MINFLLPLEAVGDGGDISISIDSPLHRDNELGVKELSADVDMSTICGLSGVCIPSMAGPDTGP